MTALLALLLALVAVALVAAGDLADERGELFDLEAQGADPADLRAQLRMRGALLVGVGIVGGIALGLALSALVVDLVQVAARVETPDPPLVGEVPWLAIAAGAVAFAVLAAPPSSWSSGAASPRTCRGTARGSWHERRRPSSCATSSASTRASARRASPWPG